MKKFNYQKKETTYTYTCKFTNKEITETFYQKVDCGYQMESGAVYDFEDLAEAGFDVFESPKSTYGEKLDSLLLNVLNGCYNSNTRKEKAISNEARNTLFSLGYIVACGRLEIVA